MTVQNVTAAAVDRDQLGEQISSKYADVATDPAKGFHLHTGEPLAAMLGYDPDDVAWLPKATVDSFAGTGNPLWTGSLPEGATGY